LSLDEAFKLIANKLTEKKIPWWLEYGSLLGAVREGKRIEWDDDYDIGYPLEYAPKVLKILLSIDELEICGNLYFLVKNKKEEYHICLDPLLNINGRMYRLGENKILSSINVGEYFLYPFIRSLPIFFQELLVRVSMKFYRVKSYSGDIKDYRRFIKKDMGGVSSPIPIGYDNLLKINFGDDYMIPNKDKSSCYKDGRSHSEMVQFQKEEIKNIKKD